MDATNQSPKTSESWPDLRLSEWKETCDTLHMWTQIVGKVKLVLSPMLNHWWQVPFFVSARGLSSGTIPYAAGIFEVNFDFIAHQLVIVTSTGATKTLPLKPQSVAAFYQEFMETLRSLDIEVKINTMPSEFPNPIAFEQDTVHAAYDPEYVNRFWRILVQTDKLFNQYRSRFIGKASLVNFYWGTFDLSLSLFSGKPAPARPKADSITREAYSHEEISCGFWPGDDNTPEAALYAYTVPAPPGLSDAAIQPAAAFYVAPLSGFVLPYAVVRAAASPEQTILEFLQSNYAIGTKLAQWNLAELERQEA